MSIKSFVQEIFFLSFSFSNEKSKREPIDESFLFSVQTIFSSIGESSFLFIMLSLKEQSFEQQIESLFLRNLSKAISELS